MTVVKFPYSAARRFHSRKPRRSKNGTPEERAAKAAAAVPSTNGTVALLPSPDLEQGGMSAEELRAKYEAMHPLHRASISRLILALDARRA